MENNTLIYNFPQLIQNVITSSVGERLFDKLSRLN